MKRLPRLCFVLSAAILFLSTPAFAGGKKSNDAPTVVPVSRPGVYQGYSSPQYKGFTYHSYYISMRDSILLAIDVFLPKKLEPGKKIPAILYLDRYVRSVEAKWPFNLIEDPVLT